MMPCAFWKAKGFSRNPSNRRYPLEENNGGSSSVPLLPSSHHLLPPSIPSMCGISRFRRQAALCLLVPVKQKLPVQILRGRDKGLFRLPVIRFPDRLENRLDAVQQAVSLQEFPDKRLGVVGRQRAGSLDNHPVLPVDLRRDRQGFKHALRGHPLGKFGMSRQHDRLGHPAPSLRSSPQTAALPCLHLSINAGSVPL